MAKNFRKKEAHREEKSEFEQKLVDLARVTRVVAGGKRMRFRACLVIGDKKGNIGFGIKKGADVSIAMNKSLEAARKNLIKINTDLETIPHELRVKFKAARILLRPAPKGRGIIAGGAVRIVLEMSGIKNIMAKTYGSKNKINNVIATFQALSKLKNIKKQALKKS